MNTRVPDAPSMFHTFEQYNYSFHEKHEKIIFKAMLSVS